jgi:hypothetical protein
VSPSGTGVWPGARRIDPIHAIVGQCYAGEWGDRFAEMSKLRVQLRRNLSDRSADPRQHHAIGLRPLPFYPLVFPSQLVGAQSLTTPFSASRDRERSDQLPVWCAISSTDMNESGWKSSSKPNRTTRVPIGMEKELLKLDLLKLLKGKSHWSDLNRRPLDYESRALPLSYSGGTSDALARIRTATPFGTTPSR